MQKSSYINGRTKCKTLFRQQERHHKLITLYGDLFRNIWPTWEQGTISNVPPHIHVLNESSKFSPPHMSKPESYVPSRSKNFRSIENRPPAIVGLYTGSAELWKK